MGADKMLGSGVVEILKAGFSGLVFLFGCLSYRLLSRANAQSASPRTLQNAQRFMIFTVVLMLLVAISSVVDVYMKKQDSISAHEVEQCRDAVARVETTSTDQRTTLEELRATVHNQLPACKALFEKEDK